MLLSTVTVNSYCLIVQITPLLYAAHTNFTAMHKHQLLAAQKYVQKYIQKHIQKYVAVHGKPGKLAMLYDGCIAGPTPDCRCCPTCGLLIPEDLVDVVGEQAADSHHLSRAGRGDGHEHYDGNEGAPSFAQHCQSRSWGDQTCCNGSTPSVWDY